MIFEVQSPYGLTGSSYIKGMSTYVSTQPFDTSNLPTPILNDVTSYSAFNVDTPVKDAPFWVMFSYRDDYGQKVYSPPVCLRDFGDGWRNIVSTMPSLMGGDGQYGYCNKVWKDGTKPTLAAIEATRDNPYPWLTTADVPTLFWRDTEYRALMVAPNTTVGTGIDLYKKGYMAISGDLTDIYGTELINALGGPVQQGATLDFPVIKWTAVLPTKDDFLKWFGMALQLAVDTGIPQIGNTLINDALWMLTSTPHPDEKGKLIAINTFGETQAVTVDQQCYVFMMFVPSLKV